MPAQYTAVLTDVGAAQVINSQVTGTSLTWSKMAVGDGGGAPVTVETSRTALVHEVYRAELTALARDPDHADQIVAEMIILPESGGYTLREIGIYDSDDRLVVYGSMAELVKPALADGAGITLTLRLCATIGSSAVVTLQTDPSLVIATHEYVGANAVKSLRSSGRTVTYTMGDGTAHTFETQDTIYTHPAYTARTGKPAANAAPAFGGTFAVSQVASDAAGHVTAMTDRTITIPSTAATTSAAGLMSAADKRKLDGIQSSAEVNQNAFSRVKVGSVVVEADAKQDTLTLAAGNNVVITADAAGDKVTIGLPSTLSASITGNAATATKLSPGAKINNILFNGTQNITIPVQEYAAMSKTAAGYIKFKHSGIIFQWHRSSAINELSTTTVTFPIAFPSACAICVGGTAEHISMGASQVAVTAWTKTNCTVRSGAGGNGQMRSATIIAIGY